MAEQDVIGTEVLKSSLRASTRIQSSKAGITDDLLNGVVKGMFAKKNGATFGDSWLYGPDRGKSSQLDYSVVPYVRGTDSDDYREKFSRGIVMQMQDNSKHLGDGSHQTWIRVKHMKFHSIDRIRDAQIMKLRKWSGFNTNEDEWGDDKITKSEVLPFVGGVGSDPGGIVVFANATNALWDKVFETCSTELDQIEGISNFSDINKEKGRNKFYKKLESVYEEYKSKILDPDVITEDGPNKKLHPENFYSLGEQGLLGKRSGDYFYFNYSVKYSKHHMKHNRACTDLYNRFLQPIIDAFAKRWWEIVDSGDRGSMTGKDTANLKVAIIEKLQETLLELDFYNITPEQDAINTSFSGILAKYKDSAAQASTEEERAAMAEAAKDSWRFDVQSYLFYQIHGVAKYRMNEKENNWKTDLQNIHLAQVSPNIVNNLMESLHVRDMFDISTAQAALLVPQVKLFSVKRYISNNFKISERPIKLNSHMDKTDVKNVFEGQRGGGYGLNNVEIEFQGTDLVTVDKLFSVKLQLHIQDVKRLTGKNLDSHIMRLIQYPIRKGGDEDIADELRLEISYGISDPSNSLVTKSMKKSINDNKMSLMLGLKDHTFTVNPDGTLDLQIDYIGRLEQTFASIEADIFPPQQDDGMDRLIKVRKQLRANASGVMLAEGDDEISVSEAQAAITRMRVSNQKAINELDKSNLRKKYQAIIDQVRSDGKLYHIRVTKEQVAAFKDYCFLANKGESLSKTDDNNYIGNYTPWKQEDEEETGYKNYSFFYFGDFVNSAMRSMTRDAKGMGEQERKYIIALGTVPTIGMGLGPDGGVNRTLHNLAFMPITLDTYNAWFEKNVTKKNKIIYPFFDFLKDVANDLIFKVLGGTQQDKSDLMRPPVSRLSMANFAVHSGSPVLKNKARVITEESLMNKKNRLYSSNVTSKTTTDVFLLYALAQEGNNSHLAGKRRADKRMGIHHLTVGRDRGLLKGISFAKANIPRWREAQTLKTVAKSERDHVFTSAPYNADVQLIGNTMFKPGMTVFIDPLVSGFGSVANPSSVANQLAIGGYYIILGVTHYIKGQTFETSLRCIWNAMPNKEKKTLPATLMKLDIDFGTTGEPVASTFTGGGPETEAQRIERERREYWEGRNTTNTGLSESATITANLVSTGRFSRSKDGKVRKRFAKGSISYCDMQGWSYHDEECRLYRQWKADWAQYRICKANSFKGGSDCDKPPKSFSVSSYRRWSGD